MNNNYNFKFLFGVASIKILEEIIKPKYLTIYDLPGAKQFRSINNTFLLLNSIYNVPITGFI